MARSCGRSFALTVAFISTLNTYRLHILLCVSVWSSISRAAVPRQAGKFHCPP